METSTNPASFKNKLIEITCVMIDKSGGSSGINMRSVAREAGCAHTNVYNYFGSFTDLLYAAMLRTMEMLIQFTQQHVGYRPNSAEDFQKFIEAQIDFAIKHTGLFRFMWLETLPGKIPEEIKAFARGLKQRFAEMVGVCAGEKLTGAQVMDASLILHSYLHGEICKMISGRDIHVKPADTINRIKANVQRLLQLLIDSHAEKL